MNRVRIEASGESEDGTFGGWVRVEGGMVGNVWWKPSDLLKLMIGGNPDGMFGKEGVTGWGFYQVGYDTGVVMGGNVFGWGPDGSPDLNMYGQGLKTRAAFFGGFDGQGALLTITPAEIATINIVIPFMNGGKAADVFMKSIAQVDLNLDFGNIALTYEGGLGYKKAEKGKAVLDPGADVEAEMGWILVKKGTTTPATASDTDVEVIWGETKAGSSATPKWTIVGGGKEVKDPSKIYLYFNLASIENLSLDVGVGYTMPYTTEAKVKVNPPMAAGLGVKYTMDTFGVKFRTVASFAGSSTPDGGKKSEAGLGLIADVLPYFIVNDNLTAYASIGVGYQAPAKYDGKVVQSNGKDDDPAIIGWHFNPYVQIGAEWGPTFYAGIKLWSDGKEHGKDKDKWINWAVPIAMVVSF
jgi:hypothetical protein